MAAMRLLIATPLYPPDPGGPATYAQNLEAGLPAHGIQAAVLKFSQVKRFPKVIRHLAYLVLLIRAGRDADAVLALDPVSTGLPAMLAAALLRKPFFVKVVGDYAWEQGTQRAGIRVPLHEFVRTRHVPPLVSFLRIVQRTVAGRARLVIVPSEYLKCIVCAWGVPAGRIEVVYNAMKEEAPGTLPLAASASTRPRVVSVGRLVPWKGMPGVIDAVARVREQVPGASLALAGDGPERDALERFMHVRLADAGIVTGALSHADTLALIGDADVFVLNSTYEGLSHLLIEAMALGRAIVATDVGGNPELIEDGKSGLLVPSGDRDALVGALAHLLKTPAHRERLGKAAQESAARFTTERMLQRTSALIKEHV